MTKTTRTTVVAEPAWMLPLVWIALPPLGAGAGWLLKLMACWVVSLPLVPFKGPFRFIESAREPYATIGVLALGGLAGLVLAFLVALDDLTVTVSDGQVTMVRGGETQRIERASVSAVFLEGKRLVLLGQATEELAREASDFGADRLGDAFLAHGFPWHKDGDPYEDDYRRWVEDTPDLPAGANALLKARARALDKGDKEDAADLRTELAKMGVIVREEKKRQQWRRTGHPA